MIVIESRSARRLARRPRVLLVDDQYLVPGLIVSSLESLLILRN